MNNSCLYPLYEYIMKGWIQSGLEMPEYENLAWAYGNPSTDGNIELEKRKKRIWEDTRAVLLLDSEEERERKLEEFKGRENECSLCLSCGQCETHYWEQLELVLAACSGKVDCEKSEFLIPSDINALLEQKDRPVDIYLDRHKRRNFRERNILVMLKGFSSSTPILLNHAKSTSLYSGGGFYFRWNGVGVAVDPGYLFVQNLHSYGLSVLDIDVVVVTHEHIDHSSDVRLLDELHYNAAENLEENEVFWSNDEFSFSKKKVPGHKLRWYLDPVTFEEAKLFREKNSGFDAEFNELHCVMAEASEQKQSEGKIHGGVPVQLSSNISMTVFPTRHEQYKKNGKKEFFHHTFGCVFDCSDKIGEKRRIGYTSDTSFKAEIFDKMKELLRTCHVIVANISGIYREDILLQGTKDRHLGYYGCFQIIHDIIRQEKCALRYYLLSEFSNQVSDIRYGVSKYMQQEVNRLTDYYKKKRIAVVPSETGLTVDLAALKIRCTSCNSYSDRIHILNPLGENDSLQYICPECMYSDEG